MEFYKELEFFPALFFAQSGHCFKKGSYATMV